MDYREQAPVASEIFPSFILTMKNSQHHKCPQEMRKRKSNGGCLVGRREGGAYWIYSVGR
jgi:hypothetical protein